MGKNMLLSALKNQKVNTLYIDNTYCNPSYSFPSREVAAQQRLYGFAICLVASLTCTLMWDTAGQERFRTNTSSCYRGAHGIIRSMYPSRGNNAYGQQQQQHSYSGQSAYGQNEP